MIKNILKIIGGLLAVAVVYVAYMILFPVSPKGKANFEVDGLNLQVEYHRPYKKGRLIFGEEKDGALVPYGKYWRTGANANTTFETNKDILFGNQELAAGKYGMYTFPYEDIWDVKLSSKNDVFFNKEFALSMACHLTKGLLMKKIYMFRQDKLSAVSTEGLRNRGVAVEYC